VEDSELAWIDAEVLEINGDELKALTSTQKKVSCKFSKRI
jgi:hypothetical protein